MDGEGEGERGEKVDRRRHRGCRGCVQPLERVRTREIYRRLREGANLQIGYIHARRWIKYSFIGRGEPCLSSSKRGGFSFLFPSDRLEYSCVRSLLAITPARLYTFPSLRFNSPSTYTCESTECLKKKKKKRAVIRILSKVKLSIFLR